jgi:hypothetical protein
LLFPAALDATFLAGVVKMSQVWGFSLSSTKIAQVFSDLSHRTNLSTHAMIRLFGRPLGRALARTAAHPAVVGQSRAPEERRRAMLSKVIAAAAMAVMVAGAAVAKTRHHHVRRARPGTSAAFAG